MCDSYSGSWYIQFVISFLSIFYIFFLLNLPFFDLNIYFVYLRVSFICKVFRLQADRINNIAPNVYGSGNQRQIEPHRMKYVVCFVRLQYSNAVPTRHRCWSETIFFVKQIEILADNPVFSRRRRLNQREQSLIRNYYWRQSPLSAYNTLSRILRAERSNRLRC